jgi:predicted amidophosphoribosyltransferase
MTLPQAPETAGFGNCPRCAYISTGTASICFECANETIEHLSRERCLICDGRLKADGDCGNPLCNDSPEERGWEYIYAISMRSGTLKSTINAYKYAETKGWAWIFGRVLVGYLEDIDLPPWDLIIPMPTYVGEGARSWDHIDLILERAMIEGPEQPIRRDVMRKTKATPRLVDQHGFYARAVLAEREFGPALEVIDRAAVLGKSVLVFDDVFTSGLTLREVARKLKAAGAREVAGIVLARQPFGS